MFHTLVDSGKVIYSTYASRKIRSQLVILFHFQPSHIDDITLWKGVWELITEPKARKKLETVNTIEDVVRLIESSKNVIVLTGAGVSDLVQPV